LPALSPASHKPAGLFSFRIAIALLARATSPVLSAVALTAKQGESANSKPLPLGSLKGLYLEQARKGTRTGQTMITRISEIHAHEGGPVEPGSEADLYLASLEAARIPAFPITEEQKERAAVMREMRELGHGV
jgi:hypothetical protein